MFRKFFRPVARFGFCLENKCNQRHIGYNRWTPIVRRRNFGDVMDDFMPSNIFRMMERNMLQMEKAFDTWTNRMEQEFNLKDKNFFGGQGLCNSDETNQDETVVYNDETFKVTLDLKHFNPNDIQVKVFGNRLMIAAEHNETEKPGSYIHRKFMREFQIPDNVVQDSLETLLTDDGMLVIKANIDSNIKDGKKLEIKPENKKNEKES